MEIRAVGLHASLQGVQLCMRRHETPQNKAAHDTASRRSGAATIEMPFRPKAKRAG
jgi:hypothetical protein